MTSRLCQTFFVFFTVCIAVAESGKNLLSQKDDVRIAATGRGAVWLAHLHGVQGVAGSNPVAPIHFFTAESNGFWAATNR